MWSTSTDHRRGLAHRGGCAPRGCARAPAWELGVARYLSDLGTARSIGNGAQHGPAQGGRRAGASRPRADLHQRRRFWFIPARTDACRDSRGRARGRRRLCSRSATQFGQTDGTAAAAAAAAATAPARTRHAVVAAAGNDRRCER